MSYAPFRIDLGGSFLKYGDTAQPESVATPKDFVGLVAVLGDVAPPGAALALSLAGLVAPDGVVRAANLPCVDGLSLAQALGTALGRRVTVANDADCFALAEARLGAGRGHAIVFGIILGTGVGGGLVVGGRLAGIAGEWGHGPITRSHAGSPPEPIARRRCGCGQGGCLDTVGGARGLEALHGGTQDSREILRLWRQGEPAATRCVNIYLDLLEEPLALLLNTLGATIAPVGGGLGGDGALVAALNARVAPLLLRRTETILVPSALGAGAGMLGAGILGGGLLPC